MDLAHLQISCPRCFCHFYQYLCQIIIALSQEQRSISDEIAFQSLKGVGYYSKPFYSTCGVSSLHHKTLDVSVKKCTCKL